MIEFMCKQCGKRHQRPEEASGTLVFCECGQGNRVPWESTAAPEEMPTPPVVEAVPEPLQERRGRPARRSRGWPRWREVPEYDPAFCFNHQDTPATQTCAACATAFCEDCVVSLQGETLCGPCKNWRIRNLTRPSRISLAAVFSLVVAVAGGPLAFCFMSMGAGFDTPAVGWLGVLPQLAALLLGCVALRHIETNPQMGGRALAMTSILAALVGTTMVALMITLVQMNLGM